MVDDGSSDETPEVCRRYGVQYHRLESSRYRNPSVARNVGYRAARGDVILAQSDDVVHISPHAIEWLTCNLRPGEFLLAQVDDYQYQHGKPAKFVRQHCGPACKVPYFFLGAIWRSDLYAVGGNDEEFVEPCFDDNWFASCLVNGLGLSGRYTPEIRAHHQHHGYEAGSHDREDVSRKLYEAKVQAAKRTGCYCSSGGPWTENLDTPEGKIPKCVHFFWTGPRMSWARLMTLRSFRHHNPDWRMVLHTMGEVDAGGLEDIGLEIRPWEPPLPGLPPAHASDLCGWEQLGSGGGFVADLDILFVRSMPYAQVRDADAVFCLTGGYAAVGLLGASPGCQLLQDVAAEALAGYSVASYQSTGAEAIYRLARLPRWGKMKAPGKLCLARFRRDYPELAIRELPERTVYPFSHTETRRIFCRAESLPAGCVGLHWFGGDPLSQEWIGRLTAENWRDHHNTYTAVASHSANVCT